MMTTPVSSMLRKAAERLSTPSDCRLSADLRETAHQVEMQAQRLRDAAEECGSFFVHESAEQSKRLGQLRFTARQSADTLSGCDGDGKAIA